MNKKQQKITIELKLQKIKFIGKTSYEIRSRLQKLILLLKFINDYSKNDQPVTTIIFKEGMLPSVPLIGVMRILKRLQDLGLIDYEDLNESNENTPIQLTEKGLEAISRGEIFVPAEDMLEISLINHPIFPQKLYSIKKIDENAPTKSKEKSSDTLPTLDTIGVDFEHEIYDEMKDLIIPFQDGDIILKKIDPKITKPEYKSVILNITLTPNNVTAELNDSDAKIKNRPIPIPEEITFSNVLMQIINHEPSSWLITPDDDHILLRSVHDVKTDELVSFTEETYTPNTPMILEILGQVYYITLHNFPIQPKTPDDAQQWFDKALLARLQTSMRYMTELELQKLMYELFNQFINHYASISVPKSTKDLVSKIPLSTNNRSLNWCLLAPIHLHGVD